MFNIHDISKNQYMLDGSFAYQGYDWWWHSFTARRESDGEEVPFFIEFFLCNPAHGGNKTILGQSEKARERHLKPSYLMVKVGCWGKNKVQLNRFIPWSEVSIKRKGAFEMYWHAEGMKTYVAGDIWLNGEKYKVIPECSY